jgi:thiamine-phosphate pyrophosphorylase
VRVVLITDRSRFTDIPERVAAIARAVPPGSLAIQVREKDTDGGPLLAFVRELQAAAPGVPIWVNDRIDVALAADVAGVHLPEHGLSIDDARAVAGAAGRPLSIGVSRHTVEAALRSAAADVVQLGPIYETPGKGPRLGPAALAVRAQLPPSTKLVAVGGIDSVERAREAVAAGADAVALIRGAWASEDPVTLVASIVATRST